MRSYTNPNAVNPFEGSQLVPRSTSRKSYGMQFDIKKKTLVLDLNHTLVYLTMEKPNKDTTTYVQIPNKNETPAYVIKRPGLDLFIKEMSALFNICIYTAKKAKYADAIVEAVGLTPYIFEVYTREHCTKITANTYMKSLLNLGFSFSNTIFVDDSAKHMRIQPLNGILIQAFKGEMDDSGLIILSPFLRYIATEDDVRPVTQKLYAFFEVETKGKVEKRAAGKSRDFSDGLPSISEVKEEEDEKTPKIFISKQTSTTVSLDTNWSAEKSERPEEVTFRAKESVSTIVQIRKSLSLPTNPEIEKMYFQRTSEKFGTVESSGSLGD